jgi:hypothetical protein
MHTDTVFDNLIRIRNKHILLFSVVEENDINVTIIRQMEYITATRCGKNQTLYDTHYCNQFASLKQYAEA